MIALSKEGDFSSDSSDVIRLIVGLSPQVQELFQGFELVIVSVLVMVVGDLFRRLTFQSVERVMELCLSVSITSYLRIDLVLEFFYPSS